MSNYETSPKEKSGNAGTLTPTKDINQNDNTISGGSVSKEVFIEKLEELLKMADLDVIYLMPRYSHGGELDTIEIGYVGGGRRYVCVAMDSHAAIIRDVMEGVA